MGVDRPRLREAGGARMLSAHRFINLEFYLVVFVLTYYILTKNKKKKLK